MFPVDVELLVAPRHIHVAGVEISAVVMHLRDVQREAATHRFGHRLFDLLLRLAGPGPIPLDHLVPMLDLNKRATRVVTRAP